MHGVRRADRTCAGATGAQWLGATLADTEMGLTEGFPARGARSGAGGAGFLAALCASDKVFDARCLVAIGAGLQTPGAPFLVTDRACYGLTEQTESSATVRAVDNAIRAGQMSADTFC